MPPTPRMKRGTRKLSEVARHLVLPSGIASTGYPSVKAQCRKMGVVHDDWQQGLGRAVLAKRETGLYAAGIGGVVLSTCRQVGKTFTFGTLIFALCTLTPNMTVLWTAHHTRTSDETFDTLSGMTQRPQVAPFVKKVLSGNGKQSIHFTNGSRILFGAREQGFGRGIPGVSVVVFDEAQILKQSALNDMIPAANTVRNPLILYMGTPPDPKDPADVFKARRRQMLEVKQTREAGEDTVSNTLYVEFGADSDADLGDRKQWAKGNPSYPQRTPAESMMRLREQLADDGAFSREGMGIWDEDQAGSRAISSARWEATGVTVAPAEGVRSFGVAFSADGMRMSVGGALKHADGMHVELVDAYAGAVEGGLAPLADWFAERDSEGVARWRKCASVVVSGRAGAAVLQQLLLERKVHSKVIVLPSTPQYFQACGMFDEAVRDASGDSPQVTHLVSEGQSALDESVAVCDKQKRGRDGSWAWSSTVPDGDETPLEAVSLALWGARTSRRKPHGTAERGKGVIL